MDKTFFYVIKDGNVADRGTHARLMEKDGLYRRMYEAHMSVKDGGREDA